MKVEVGSGKWEVGSGKWEVGMLCRFLDEEPGVSRTLGISCYGPVSVKSDLPERTFEFARRVVVLCRFLDQEPGVSRTLGNQLLRSGTSIGANVEEV